MTSASDTVSVRLEIPRESRAGATVPIVLRVENLSKGPIDLYLRGRTIAFDVVVTQGATAVWRRSEGETIPAIVQLRRLAPGDGFRLRASWNQRTTDGESVTPGRYELRGILLTDATPLETAPVGIRIGTP